MSKDLFSELQDLGFDDTANIDLFNKQKKETEKNEKNTADDKEEEKALLYDREVVCPVCEAKFKVKALKKSGFKPEKRDSDSFVYYIGVNPYFYDVWICNKCGYASMEADFFKIKSYQITLITEKITPKWHGKVYPEVFDVNIAIERYKLALLNYFYMDAKASKKAMTCLKIAWMYRILKDDAKEIEFLKQAIEGFEAAYFNEDFPLYKLDKFSMLYLLGELNRRVGNNEKALSWFSQVILAINAPQRLKEKTRDQRDLINADEDTSKKAHDKEYASEDEGSSPKKEGFFSRFFKK